MACLALLLALSACVQGYDKADVYAKSQPQIFPDYAGVTFPKNIAPPNFRILDEAEAYQVVLTSANATPVTIVSGDPEITIPEGEWRDMLAKAAGHELRITIGTRHDGRWTEYKSICDTISRDTIDRYLVYRLLYPGYELWNEMGIYQRDLSTYEERPILENKQFGKMCVNCHTFRHNSPSDMMVHVRGKNGGTLIYQNGEAEKVSSKPGGIKMGATYAGWHPSGRFIAFSLNDVQQFFHSSGTKLIEVSDMAADMGVYDIEKQQMLIPPSLGDSTAMETFPAWSPDGRTLYFCRGNAYSPTTPLDSLRYDLCRISFDPDHATFGQPECVYAASKSGHTVSLPRVSPDGRYLVFVEFDYGTFSIWHHESQLMLLDLQTGSIRPMDEVNSPDVESFHTWSSTGRWLVFSSKRIDGQWAHPYFAHFDARTGRFSKPFLLPQQSPRFYDNFMKTFNLPELITAPITCGDKLLKAIGK